MKKSLTPVILAFITFFLSSKYSAILALAQDDGALETNWTALNQSFRFRDPSLFISQLLGGTNPGPSYTSAGILTIAIILGGVALLVMLILGGFTLLTNATNPQGQEQGKQQITWAIVGFVLLFASYWIIQIFEIIFKINIV